MTQRSPVVLITGTSSGIGKAVATAFAARGLEVFGTSRNPQRSEPIAGVELLPLDVSDQASVTAAGSIPQDSWGCCTSARASERRFIRNCRAPIYR